MARKDREIAALTAELRALDAARPGGGDGGAADAGPEKSGGHSSEEGSGDVQPQPHSRDFARLCLQSQVARLAQLAAAQDLRNADPTGGGLKSQHAHPLAFPSCSKGLLVGYTGYYIEPPLLKGPPFCSRLFT